MGSPPYKRRPLTFWTECPTKGGCRTCPREDLCVLRAATPVRRRLGVCAAQSGAGGCVLRPLVRVPVAGGAAGPDLQLRHDHELPDLPQGLVVLRRERATARRPGPVRLGLRFAALLLLLGRSGGDRGAGLGDLRLHRLSAATGRTPGGSPAGGTCPRSSCWSPMPSTVTTCRCSWRPWRRWRSRVCT